MTDDPFKDPNFVEYAEHVIKELVPKLKDSDLTVSLAPTDGIGDVKFAVELGFSIMLDKPIIVVAHPDAKISPALRRAAVSVVFADITTKAGQKLMADAIDVELPRESNE